MREAIERLDALMNRLIEADQTAAGLEPLEVANELGSIRQLMIESPSVLRAEGDQRHFRCETCGTIVHGAEMPERCRACGSTSLFAADLQQPNVESGAG